MFQTEPYPPQGELAVIAAGSNMARGGLSRQARVRQGLARAAERLGTSPRLSGLYATPAVPEGSGPDFINAVMALETTKAPPEILALLHEVEAEHDRERPHRWAPRTLDLDLICLGDRIAPDASTLRRWIELPPGAQQAERPEELLLPHPRLQDRSFVLVPMAEVAPGWRHPLLGRTVAEMRADRPAEELARIRADG